LYAEIGEMSSGYYVSGPKRSERVRILFGRIAGRYDLINDIQSLGLHRFWKRTLIEAARPRPSDTALDVCCGTGDIALGLSRRVERVVGCDFSLEMLARARARGSQRVSWIVGDALHLPFSENLFDVVTIGYGLRNLSDFSQGLGELVRVLKPGGRLLILDFGKPANPLLRAVYFTYLRLIVPVYGLLLCGDSAAYNYILESLREYPAQSGVTHLLERAGCKQIQVRNFLGGAMSVHIARKNSSLCQSDDVPLEAGHIVRE
jgi:demethylmenaquinone methyltransferase / 2-methoxy-6-polyprenyl-1,4-benzoquinol methylase